MRASVWQVVILGLMGVSAFVLAGGADDMGIPRKWLTAFFGTLIPFSFVMYAFRQRVLRWSFWMSFLLCLALHLIVMWAVFQYALAGFRSFSPLLWYPVMLVEIFVLFIAVKRVEEKIVGERYKMSVIF